jgi:hypothetical protein
MSLLALLLVAAEPASAPTTAQKPKPKLVCRDSETHLGTRMRTGRQCKTPEEWQQEDAERDRVPVTLRVTPGQGDGVQPTQSPQ